jgi:type VII secretion integral membrane protein EccD
VDAASRPRRAVGRAAAEARVLVRVTVTSSTRRVDLVLPGVVPVAELVPELARSVGLLDPVTVYGGYHLVTRDGRALATHAGLTLQGVEDGDVITIAAGVDDEPPRVYDDVVEAMADAVERDLEPWDAATGRRTALWAAVALLVMSAAALLLERGSDLAAGAALVVTVTLVLAAVALSRVRRDTGAAVTVAMVGCGYAAMTGLLDGRGAPSSGTSVAAAGGGALLAGIVAALGLGSGRTLLLPTGVAGAVFLATGLVMRSWSGDPAVVLTTVLALATIAGSAFPWFALGVIGTSIEPLFVATGTALDASPIDPECVAADARTAHEILVALSATEGLLLVLVSAPAVSLGPAGAAVSVLACVVVMLRTRHHHAGAEVLVGLTSGVLGLLGTSVSVLWLQPSWRPVAAVALEAAGAAILALTLLPRIAPVPRGRLADVAEGVALLALLPALVTATGVLPALRG